MHSQIKLGGVGFVRYIHGFGLFYTQVLRAFCISFFQTSNTLYMKFTWFVDTWRHRSSRAKFDLLTRMFQKDSTYPTDVRAAGKT